ncbi:MAG: hypothetical protein CVT92_09930 [Bacteroidetes bacterium HGW-Bacteroidetes-1]|jgi:outer membrane protein TolC|nr:MAG: hypothetical protein CVT92_09930 [Bacteroidetes bacterium HGW-Bacteroidetes-1]
MKKGPFFLLTYFLLLSVAVQSQTSRPKIFFLSQIVDSAMSNYPLSRQHALLANSTELAIDNLSATYWPILQINGQVSYQSDVTQLGISLPGFSTPELSKDWYKLNLDLTQMIYDGGVVGEAKALEANNLDIRKSNIKEQENSYLEMISKLYFRTLLLRQQENVLNSMIRGLDAIIFDLRSAVEHGSILPSELKSLQAEQLQLKQQKIEIIAGIQSTLIMLSEYTKMDISLADSLAIPLIDYFPTDFVNERPEWLSMTKQQEKVSIQKQLIHAKRKPVILAFAQAGYGRPGYNMLDDTFDDYYMVGLRFNYKIWDWNTASREKQQLDLQSEIVGTNKEYFDTKIRAAYKSQLSEIQKMSQLLENDHQIVSLQQEVTASSKSALLAGSLTSAAYLQEMEKLVRAHMMLETNRIKLINAKTELMFITGKISFYE